VDRSSSTAGGGRIREERNSRLCTLEHGILCIRHGGLGRVAAVDLRKSDILLYVLLYMLGLCKGSAWGSGAGPKSGYTGRELSGGDLKDLHIPKHLFYETPKWREVTKWYISGQYLSSHGKPLNQRLCTVPMPVATRVPSSAYPKADGATYPVVWRAEARCHATGAPQKEVAEC
jgi:hypothetical protein